MKNTKMSLKSIRISQQLEDASPAESSSRQARSARRRSQATERQKEMQPNELTTPHPNSRIHRSSQRPEQEDACLVQPNSLQRRRAARVARAAAHRSPQELEMQENDHSNTFQQHTHGRRGIRHEPQGQYICTATFQIPEEELANVTYTACKVCTVGLNADPNKVFWCFKCKDYIEFEERIKITLELQNETNSVRYVSFKEHAESLLGVSPTEILEMTTNEKAELCALRNDEIQQQMFRITIKKKIPTSTTYNQENYILARIEDYPPNRVAQDVLPTTPPSLQITESQSSGITPELQQLSAQCPEKSTTAKDLLPSFRGEEIEPHHVSQSDLTGSPSKKTKMNINKSKTGAPKQD